jgi:hypothetical protein
MGFKIKAPKISVPKISAPKITADPGKFVNKAVSGVTNTTVGVTGSVLGGVGAIGGQAVGAVGGILSQPGAAPILGAAGSFAGIPGLGDLAAGFAPQPNYGTGAIEPQYMPEAPTASAMPRKKDNTMLYAGIGGGGLVLVLLLVFMMKKKKR